MGENELEDHDAVPRSRVFVLLDGTFVVRWSDNRVQELETGHYRIYQKRDFGASITDYELHQLQVAGLVEAYDKDYVWLCPLPERRLLDGLTEWERNRTRSYYLNTVLPGSHLKAVNNCLNDLQLADEFMARIRDDFVVLWASKGMAFYKFDDAEKARHLLIAKAPDMFQKTVVAFVETTRR
ncbi:MAG: hypothetical protein D6711_04545 [Chloroflexi bacterium]|nr:MAG: hypothetical protein D6711_04545 [Chloroflexota bacterium]